jgi:Large polyvalent protein associated domain 38
MDDALEEGTLPPALSHSGNSPELEEGDLPPPAAGKRPPPAFMDRVDVGTKLADWAKSTTLGTAVTGFARGVKEGWSEAGPVGFSPESERFLADHGLRADPQTGKGGPLTMAAHGVMQVADSAVSAVDLFMKATSAGVTGTAEMTRDLLLSHGASQGEANRAARDVQTFAQFMMAQDPMMARSLELHRVEHNPEINAPVNQPVGRLPQLEDFHTAAKAVNDGDHRPEVQAKLQDIWDQRGIHPAEVVADAQANPVLLTNLLSDSPDLPEPYFSGHGLMPAQFEETKRWMTNPNGALVTRRLPDGSVIPDPTAVASYLQKFGEEAGFKFQVGPEQLGKYDDNGPHYQAYGMRTGQESIEFRGGFVHVPESTREIYDRWYGMSPEQVMAHEVGHALDYNVLGKASAKLESFPPELKEEIERVSRQFRPQLWAENPKYNSTSVELMADAVAQYMTNPVARRNMPEFTKMFGDKLEKYLDIANRNIPTLTESGEWTHPPRDEFTPGRGGEGGGGQPPGPPNGAAGADDSAPKQIAGPVDMEALGKRIDTNMSINEVPDKSLSWGQVWTNLVDRFNPIRQAVSAKLDQTGIPKIEVFQDPYKLARLYAGWAGKATNFLKNETFDYRTYERTGESLEKILAPVKDKLTDFRRFVASGRAAELAARDIETGFDMEAVNQWMGRTLKTEDGKLFAKTFEQVVDYQNRAAKYLADSGVLSQAGYKAMVESNRLFVPFHVIMNQDRLGISAGGNSLQAGNPIHGIGGADAIRIDPIETIVKNTYVLLAMAEKNTIGTALVNLLQRGEETIGGKGTPELKQIEYKTGTGKELVTHMDQTYGVKRTKGLDELGDVMHEWTRPEREGELSIYRDGHRETYTVDSELANAWKGLDGQTAGFLEKIMAPWAGALRTGAVLTPDFMARHTVRDFLYTFATIKNGVFTPFDLAKGMAGYIIKDADYWDWQKAGGGSTSMASFDRSYMQEDLAALTKETGLFSRAYNVVWDPKASWLKNGMGITAAQNLVVHPLQMGTELVTSASHLGVYKKTKRGLESSTASASREVGMPQRAVTLGGAEFNEAMMAPSVNKQQILTAAWTSRDTGIDIARIGAKMKAVNMISAFANVKIQDLVSIPEKIATAGGAGKALTTTLKVMAGITAPSVVLWYLQHNDSRYQDVPTWEKNVFWIVLTDKWEKTDATTAASYKADQRRIIDGELQVNNGHIWRIPKPFTAGVVFGSLVERGLDHFADTKPDAFRGLGNALAETSIGDLMPNMLAPVFDQAMNRSAFTGRTMVPAAAEKLLPEYQYTAYTTQTTKAVAKAFSKLPGIREASLDNTSIKGGGLARALTTPIYLENYIRQWTGGLGNYALAAIDYGLQKSGAVPPATTKPDWQLADVPVIKAFAVRHPDANTDNMQKFYEGLDRDTRFFATWQNRAKAGDADAAEEIQAAGGQEIFARLDGFKKVLAGQSKMIRGINDNPQIPGAEKRQQIDQIYRQMVAVGDAAYEAYSKIHDASEKARQR